MISLLPRTFPTRTCVGCDKGGVTPRAQVGGMQNTYMGSASGALFEPDGASSALIERNCRSKFSTCGEQQIKTARLQNGGGGYWGGKGIHQNAACGWLRARSNHLQRVSKNAFNRGRHKAAALLR